MARVYTDRDLIELFRMLLRQQIREERINSISELHGLLEHVDEALAEPTRTLSNAEIDRIERKAAR